MRQSHSGTRQKRTKQANPEDFLEEVVSVRSLQTLEQFVSGKNVIRLRSDPNNGRTAHFWTKPAAVVYLFTSSGVLLEFSCVLIVTNHSEVQDICRKTHLVSMGDVNVLIQTRANVVVGNRTKKAEKCKCP